MNETPLPPAPTLSQLQLPPWILSRLTDYFNQLKSMAGVEVVASSSSAERAACLYALLGEFTKHPCQYFALEREARYELPQPPQRFADATHDAWQEKAKNGELSLDDLSIMNTESIPTRILVSSEEELQKAIRINLRWDPDLLLIDGISVADTYALAETASFTGHAVLAGVPVTRAAHTLVQLAGQSKDPTDALSAVPFVLACEPIGSTNVAAYELIFMTPEMHALLQSKPSAEAIWKLATTQGSRSMLDDAREKAAQGNVSAEDLQQFEEFVSQTRIN